MCVLLWKCTTSNLSVVSYRDVLEFERSECVHELRDREVHGDDRCDWLYRLPGGQVPYLSK